MIIATIDQQPGETLDYDFDCKSLFNNDDSDSLASAVAAVAPAGLTVNAVVSDANTAKLWISGGNDGDDFVVTLTLTSTNGRVKEDEVEVFITEEG